MKKSELRAMIREVLKEELAAKNALKEEAVSEKEFVTFYGSKLNDFVKAIKAAGCTNIIFDVDADGVSLPTYTVTVKDVYKLNKDIPKSVSIFVRDSEYGINGFVEDNDNSASTDLMIEEDYHLTDVEALIDDILNALDFILN
jgi:hypothetical protein